MGGKRDGSAVVKRQKEDVIAGEKLKTLLCRGLADFIESS
jgi:hypothetical protein